VTPRLTVTDDDFVDFPVEVRERGADILFPEIRIFIVAASTLLNGIRLRKSAALCTQCGYAGKDQSRKQETLNVSDMHKWSARWGFPEFELSLIYIAAMEEN